MQPTNIPMSSSYSTVFTLSILMIFVVIIVGAVSGSKSVGFGIWYWGYTAWKMYKRDNISLVSLQKFMLWLQAIIFTLVVIFLIFSNYIIEGSAIISLLVFAAVNIALTYFLYHFFLEQLGNYSGEIKSSSSAKKSPDQTPDEADRKNYSSASTITDNQDRLWAHALDEFESESRVKGLYAKLYTRYDGDAQKIKSQYLKTRFQELKNEQDKIIEKKKEEEYQTSRYIDALEKITKSNLTKIEKVESLDCFIFRNGKTLVKINDEKHALYTDFDSAEKSIRYQNVGAGHGFVDWVFIGLDKRIISCPKCRKKSRVPANKELEIKCPSCSFVWTEKT
jgi:hypothetical protein